MPALEANPIGNPYDVRGVKDVTSSQEVTIPARMNTQELYGRYALQAGYPEKGYQIMAEGRKSRIDNLKEALVYLDKAREYGNQGNDKIAQRLIAIAKEIEPSFEGAEFNKDARTGNYTSSFPVREDSRDPNSKIIGHQIITTDPNGKQVSQHFEPIKEFKGIVNMPPAYDLVGTKYFGEAYQTPDGQKKFAELYKSSPQVQKEVMEQERQTATSKFMGFPPIYSPFPGYQMPGGAPAVIDARKGEIKPASGPPVQKTPSESDVSEARKFQAVDAVIEETDRAFKVAEKSLPKDSYGRIMGYPARVGGVLTQSDPNLAYADSLSKGFLAKYARAVGELGPLTEGDIARAEKLVPSIHDTAEVRKLKVKGQRDLYKEIYERSKRQANPLGGGQPEPRFKILKVE
jgi:hypothetical protein